jgi:hypothetical protein
MIPLDDALAAALLDPATRLAFVGMLEQANASRVETNLVHAVSPVASIPFKARGMFQIGLRRSIEIADSFVATFNASLYAPLFILARSSVETGCLMWEFWMRMAEILLTNDKAALLDFDDRMIKAILGRKVGRNGEAPEYQAPNVLTIIQRHNKDLGGLEALYANLSEIAHPNHDGMLALYCSDRHEGQDFIDRPLLNAPVAVGAAFHALTLGLKQSVLAAQNCETFGSRFAILCEEAIHDKGTWPTSIPYPIDRG